MSRSNHSSRNRCEAALPPVLQQCRLTPSLVSSSLPTWFGMRGAIFPFYGRIMSRFNHSFRNRCEAVLPPVLQQCRLIPNLISSSFPTWFGMRGAINVWVHISGLRVQNSWLRLRVQGSGLCAQGLCSRIISKAKESDLNAQMVQGSGFRAQGSRFRVQGSMSGFRVQGSGVRANAQESGSNIMNQSSTLSAQLSALSVHC